MFSLQEWEVYIPYSFSDDNLVENAFKDLGNVGNKRGFVFTRVDKLSGRKNFINFIEVKDLPKEGVLINSKVVQGVKGIFMKASSPIGCARGLYWLTDRVLKVGTIPLFNGLIKPFFDIRSTYISMVGTDNVSLENALRRIRLAARVGVNHILVSCTENFIEWGDSFDKYARKYRDMLKILIKESHDLHMKVLTYGDEFIYRDEWIKRFCSSLRIGGKGLWNAIKEKYRSLLEDLPELDGVAVRTGEVIQHDGFRSLDILHCCRDEPYSLVYRYRKILDTIYDVVVREYGKIYLHRTWATNDWEQHSVPEILQQILDGFPKHNFILSIKLTEGDQWEFQPFNPTIGSVPHTTVVELETGRAHQWGGPVMDFAAEYFQAGLQYALMKGVRGVTSSIPNWKPDPKHIGYDALPYVAWRLVFDPYEDLERILDEWAKQFFGEASSIVAKIMLKLDDAVRYSYYVPFYSYRIWEPHSNIYGNMFICKGNPFFDNGRGHDEYLKEIYLNCRPYLRDVWDIMERGVSICDEIIEMYKNVMNLIREEKYRSGFYELLQHMRDVLLLNTLYVKAYMSYFMYRDKRSSYWRSIFSKNLSLLKQLSLRYKDKWNFYKLYGIDEFIMLADTALKDIDYLEYILGNSLDSEGVKRVIRERMRLESEEENKMNKTRVLRWEGVVDGRDLLLIRDSEIRIEHLLAEPITSIKYKFFQPVERRKAHYIVKRIRCRGYAFVLEDPSPRNDYTLKVYIEDTRPSSDKYVLEIYRVDEKVE